MRSPFVIPALLALTALFAGCRQKEVAAYRVPKEKAAPAHFEGDGHDHGSTKVSAPAAATPTTPPPPASGGAMAATAVPTAGGASLAWTAPAHWQSKPASAMRKGTYIVPGAGGATAELSITAFPGDVGGEVANVNRWRGQIQLAPMTDKEIAGAIVRLEQHGLKIGVIEMTNPAAATPTRVLGAFVPYAGSTWFFKFSGPDGLVAAEKAAFIEFVKSVRAAAAP